MAARGLVRLSVAPSVGRVAAQQSVIVVRHMSAAARKLPPQKKLFTPGPLGVTLRVKEAMLRDLGSRDTAFIKTVKEIRERLLHIAGVSPADFTAIPVQGSGTFAVESAITTSVPKKGGKLLVVYNGAYGSRILNIAAYLGIETIKLEFAEGTPLDLKKVADVLAQDKDKSITNVATVHCETSSGMINPVEEIGQLVAKHNPNINYFVDAMSSFGAVPLDLIRGNVHFMVSSANKCIQGVPGFSYVVANRKRLDACAGNSRSLSLDLVEQEKGLAATGQFRFTPATHSMLAFREALQELEEEGGPVGRAARYKENRRILREGMAKFGFKEFVDPSLSGYIITSYRFPEHPNFDFESFYSRLNDRNLVIYPGKVTKANCFRIGTIGDLHPSDMRTLLSAIADVCREMQIPLPLKA